MNLKFIGDKNEESHFYYLTISNYYKILDILYYLNSQSVYKVIDDIGDEYVVKSIYFETIQQNREDKINKLKNILLNEKIDVSLQQLVKNYQETLK